ncbi:MAG: short-chain dehydrogenase [Candidatus Thorarchaeota archaeon]|nr:MAG: short-chain dehydrogenase [Candidatus Thorarchaeota archaeon]
MRQGCGHMQGKVCIVTGSSSGIGKATAEGLAKLGARVIMVVRNQQRGEEARSEIIKNSGNDSVDLLLCDLASMSDIKKLADVFLSRYSRLDVLINNAGAVFDEREVTVDGFERTLAVNYLAPFLLTRELLTILKTSAPARVINLTSGLHVRGRVDFEDLQSERHYSGMSAYANAKLMVLMFTYELAKRLNGTGITVNAVHPGFVATNLGRNTGSKRSSVMFGMMRPFQISPQKAAETPVYLASSPEVQEMTGRYWSKMQERRSSEASYDRETQERLWTVTEDLISPKV